MNIIDTIAASEARPFIDGLIMEKTPSSLIATAVGEKYGTIVEPADIEKYRQAMPAATPEVVKQIVQVTNDLAGKEMPATDELSKLSMNFSFQKTNEDLDLLYDRIRKLKVLADANPDDPTYDRRISEYIAKAEAIRTRVFKHQYEQIRQAILLTVGKKIATAAVSILVPYIHRDHKQDAMRRFQAAIEKLLDMKTLPDVPEDIVGTGPTQ